MLGLSPPVASAVNRQRLLPWSYAFFRGCLKCPSAPIGWARPPEPGHKVRPRTSSTCRRSATINDAANPSWTFAPLRSMTRADLCDASRPRTPLQGSCPFSTFGNGKRLLRVYLARLSCAFRVSHPPGASFLPKPCRHVSDDSALGIPPFEGFPFRGIDLPSGRPGPPGVGSNGPTDDGGILAHLPGFALRGSPLPTRCKQREGPRLPWASPPPGVVFPFDGRARHAGLLP
jgi:hypothetical protein